MNDLGDIFLNIQLVYSFSSLFGGLAFLGRINTRVCTKILPQYQTIHKCAVPTKTIFITWEKLRLFF